MKIRELLAHLERIASEEGNIEVLLHVTNDAQGIEVECIGDIRTIEVETNHSEDDPTKYRFVRIVGNDDE